MRLKLETTFGLTVVLLLLLTSCGQQRLRVVHMPTPDYPFGARSKGLQGTVAVRVGIGTDGKVEYAVGKGADFPLVQAAEQNAKGWIFEVPAHAQFPLEHQIKYTFIFNREGAPNSFPKIVTDLPDAVEVIGTPAGGDEFLLIPPEATPSTKEKLSDVTVSVKDEEGAVVGNAFSLLRTDSLERENPVPFSSEKRTDSLGQVKRTIPQGFYDVFIASSGFAPYCGKLRVRDGKPVRVDVVLKIDKLMSQEYEDTFDDKEVKVPHQKK